MNEKERSIIMRLRYALDKIPFPAHNGTKTTTAAGIVGYVEDMRAIKPYIQKVLDGLAMKGIEGLEVGFDFEDPGPLTDAIEKWIEDRNSEGWEKANEYSFYPYFEEYREKNFPKE